MQSAIRRRAAQFVLGAASAAVSAAALAAAPGLYSVDGTDFPQYAIALFYDDGPDVYSLDLAQYLHDNHVTATFNLVGSLNPVVKNATPPDSSRGGTGYILNTQYLGQLVSLHQRLSNHTLNHVPLTGNPAFGICSYDPHASAATKSCIRYQVEMGQNYIAPYITNDLYTLTPPGGSWSGLSDPALSAMDPAPLHINPGPSYPIGNSSFSIKVPTEACGLQNEKPGHERTIVNSHDYCYAELGYSAEYYAHDLQNSISSYSSSHHHGFYVFLHDRNEGAPGSTYALDATEYLIPYLQRNGFVFVGPVMWFSKPVSRTAFMDRIWANPGFAGTFRAADVTGDGHISVCAFKWDGVYCAHSQTIPSAGPGSAPDVGFDPEEQWDNGAFEGTYAFDSPSYADTFNLADVNQDGKADLVIRTAHGIAVAPSIGGRFEATQLRSSSDDFSDHDGNPLAGSRTAWKDDPSKYETFRMADVNGDGYPDICARAAAGIVCALNDGHGNFLPYTLWEGSTFTDANGWKDARYAATMMLADMNGDGKADLVIRESDGIYVALSSGHGFDAPKRWSQWPDFSNSDVDPVSHLTMNWLQNGRYQTFRAADLNGDGMADICAMGPSGMVCAMSNGTRLLKSTNWEYRLDPQFTTAKGWTDPVFSSTLMFGDINGDGRQDLIIRNLGGLLTEFAP